jgi:hypothetical protein
MRYALSAGWRRRLLFNVCDLPKARSARVMTRRSGGLAQARGFWGLGFPEGTCRASRQRR